MDRNQIIQLARRLLSAEISAEELADSLLSGAPQADAGTLVLSSASLDTDRRRRCGFPEVIYGEGKSVDALTEIITALLSRDEHVFATRIDAATASALATRFPTAEYHPVARTFRVPPEASQANESRVVSQPAAPVGLVAIITAGTSDFPVAEEARETLRWMGIGVRIIHDVGVAGPHRLPQRLSEFAGADAVIVVAGMEGALPSVVGGYVACPVIGVPTSVGYGANLGGIAPLLSMLNSCASNVTVVNIDAGFKAACVAGLITKRRHEKEA